MKDETFENYTKLFCNKIFFFLEMQRVINGKEGFKCTLVYLTIEVSLRQRSRTIRVSFCVNSVPARLHGVEKKNPKINMFSLYERSVEPCGILDSCRNSLDCTYLISPENCPEVDEKILKKVCDCPT